MPTQPSPQFNDLMSHSDGTGEGLVAAYFSRVGWPLSVGKGEEPIFARKVGVGVIWDDGDAAGAWGPVGS